MFSISPFSIPSTVHDPDARVTPRHPAVFALHRVGSGLLARIGALPYDSRDGLPSKEQQLADLGINWATDAAYDAQLAEELAHAQLRRHKGVAAATPAEPVVPPSAVRARCGRAFGLKSSI
jgi:hypothetical protein